MHYYYTQRTSATGKKFNRIHDKMEAAYAYQKKLSKEIGFVQWRDGYWTVAGRFSSVMFPKDHVVDTTIWKNVNRSSKEWMPRLNKKRGKEIAAKMDLCPFVHFEDLNRCIGYNGSPFSHIGFRGKHPQYFGFIIDPKWAVKIPSDCQEITLTQFNQIFS